MPRRSNGSLRSRARLARDSLLELGQGPGTAPIASAATYMSVPAESACSRRRPWGHFEEDAFCAGCTAGIRPRDEAAGTLEPGQGPPWLLDFCRSVEVRVGRHRGRAVCFFFFAIRWRQFCTAQQQRRGGRWILTGRRCVARWKPSPGSGSSNSNGQSEMEVG